MRPTKYVANETKIDTACWLARCSSSLPRSVPRALLRLFVNECGETSRNRPTRPPFHQIRTIVADFPVVSIVFIRRAVKSRKKNNFSPFNRITRTNWFSPNSEF